ncbi:alpha/beta fold hydrolase [Thermoactinospora rubra]|uniref:alpha/beta fold hydrolase n=1 Tax=Thermoactinospora rubra TaxID=1088767 RepID=UPI000A118B50|nr:alpha/beta hydrolase [Thermoactinospora rubra]
MSTPRFLTLPPGVTPRRIETSRGIFAVLEALPGSGVVERCPALLVPGLTGSKEDFLAVLQTLAHSGRRVVAMDLRGQYETPGPDDPAAYTCAALGADVDALAETIGGSEPVHLVGHSFGGLVARAAAIDGRARLASLTLMSTGPTGITGRRAEGGKKIIEEIGQFGLEHLWHSRFEPEAVANGVPDEIVAFLRKRLLSNSPTGLGVMAEQCLCIDDRTEQLRQAGVPVLVLFGEHDDGWPPQVQRQTARRLEAECVVVPGAVHSPAVEAPETTAAALVRFWNEAEALDAKSKEV